MKTVEELENEKKLYLDAIDILDTITEEENSIERTDDQFQYYESWATSDIKKELSAKIGEIDVQLGYIDESDDNGGSASVED